MTSPSVVTITLNPALDDSFSVPRLVPGSKMRAARLVAGTVAGLVHAWEPSRATRLGLACSAAMIETAGTSIFSRDDLTRFTDDVPDHRVDQADRDVGTSSTQLRA